MTVIILNTKQTDQLHAIGAGDGRIDDIASAALILAGLDRPGVSFQKYEHHLEILKLDMAARPDLGPKALSRAKSLRVVLHDNHNYNGNENWYDDLQNANLMSVIDTRKGLPVTLSILYMHAARHQGWRIEGVNFPQHFLLRLYGENGDSDPVILDPFNGGRIQTPQSLRALIHNFPDQDAGLQPEYFTAVSDRAILVRLLNNIKIRYLKAGDMTQTIRILDRLVLIDPAEMQHHYEKGMLLAHVKQNHLARKSLVYCLDNIEKFSHNDLVEQQVTAVLQSLDQSPPKEQPFTLLKLPEQE